MVGSELLALAAESVLLELSAYSDDVGPASETLSATKQTTAE